MIYRLLNGPDDPDVQYLSEILRLPDISRFISIDEDNYWNYVTKTENVFYFKAYENENLVAATHCEIINKTLFMDVMVIPNYRRNGIATQILSDIQSGVLPLCFDKIEVAIDKTNTASIRLFEKMNFTYISTEDELLKYIYVKNPSC